MDLPIVNWRDIIQKYTGVGSVVIPPDIRTDVVNLVQYASICHRENLKLIEELEGAKQTMLALVIQAGGQLDVPFELVDQLQPSDVLRVENVEVPGEAGEEPKKVKRFMLGGRIEVPLPGPMIQH